jgi:hypothetical protein
VVGTDDGVANASVSFAIVAAAAVGVAAPPLQLYFTL